MSIHHNHAPESGAGRAEAVPLQRLELRPDVGRVDDEVLLRRDRAPPEVTQAYDVRRGRGMKDICLLWGWEYPGILRTSYVMVVVFPDGLLLADGLLVDAVVHDEHDDDGDPEGERGGDEGVGLVHPEDALVGVVGAPRLVVRRRVPPQEDGQERDLKRQKRGLIGIVIFLGFRSPD